MSNTAETTTTTAPTPFHVMAKPTGAVCNLDCDYCFFLTKDQLYPNSPLRMTPAVQETYLRGLFAAHRGAEEVTVAWQGGEPTMIGLDFFRRAVELEAALAEPGQRVVNALQTNATLITDEWAAFFAEHDFLVGVSIDGPPAMHDAYRVDKAGKPTYHRVARGLDTLKRHGVRWNALTTIHAANADHGLEVYRFLRDEVGATHMQFIPIVERTSPELLPMANGIRAIPHRDRPMYLQAGTSVTDRSVTGTGYGQFMVEVFDEWVRHDVGTVFVQLFDTALAHWLGMDGAGLCVHEKTCGTSIALEHNGDIYACDHFVEDGYLLGNITTGTSLADAVADPRQQAFGHAKAATLPDQCRSCPALFTCNGGCPKDRFLPGEDPDQPLNYLCAGYRRIFTHIDAPMRQMAQLWTRQQPPSLVTETLVAADARRGRNEPCPCGSGAKWKRCHGSRNS